MDPTFDLVVATRCRSFRAAALAGLLAATGIGCTGGIGGNQGAGAANGSAGNDGAGADGPGPGNGGGDGTTPAECTADNPGRPKWQMAPHTVFQMRTIVEQVFGTAATNDGQVKSALANLPLDLKAKHFDSETKTISSQYVDAYLGLSRRLAALAAEQAPVRQAMEAFTGSSCAGTLELGAGCGQDFARGFVSALGKTPASAEDINALFATYNTNKTKYQSAKAYAGFVGSVLLSGRSALRLDSAERDASGSVDAHALGARLAMTLTSGLPDKTLRDKIANGTILDAGPLEDEGQRLLRTERGRATLRHFARQWLNLAMLKSPPGREGFVATVAESELMAKAAADEVGTLFENAVLTGGTLNDFYATNDVVPNHAWLAHLYERPMSKDLSRASAPQREGLLSRAAFALHGAFADWLPLAHRGYGVKVTMLCGAVGAFPDNVDTSVPAGSPDVMSSSDYFKTLTERGTCTGCHAAMNPFGYALSAYSVIGERMTREQVRNVSSKEMVEVDIDETSAIELDGASVKVAGAGEVSLAIGGSRDARVCFAHRLDQYAVGAQEELGCAGPNDPAADQTLEQAILAYVTGSRFAAR